MQQEKKYTEKDMDSIAASSYLNGHNAGYEEAKAELHPGAVWVKCSEKKPDVYKLTFKDKHGNIFNGNYSKETGQYYAYGFPNAIWDVVEWLDVSGQSKEGNKEAVDVDELWDEHSELIEDDIDSLSRWAGSTVVDKEQFRTVVAKIWDRLNNKQNRNNVNA